MLKTLVAVMLLCGAVVLPHAASAASAWEKSVPSAQTVGKGQFHYLFMHIYDAELFAPDGTFSPDGPFALRLTYHRDFEGADIADESIRQMRKQGMKDEAMLAGWQAEMRKLFPDVKKGESLTGIRAKNGSAVFYKNDVLVGTIENPAFTDAFFNIWLSSKTTEPSLRKKLLGIVK